MGFVPHLQGQTLGFRRFQHVLPSKVCQVGPLCKRAGWLTGAQVRDCMFASEVVLFLALRSLYFMQLAVARNDDDDELLLCASHGVFLFVHTNAHVPYTFLLYHTYMAQCAILQQAEVQWTGARLMHINIVQRLG